MWTNVHGDEFAVDEFVVDELFGDESSGSPGRPWLDSPCTADKSQMTDRRRNTERRETNCWNHQL